MDSTYVDFLIRYTFDCDKKVTLTFGSQSCLRKNLVIIIYIYLLKFYEVLQRNYKPKRKSGFYKLNINYIYISL